MELVEDGSGDELRTGSTVRFRVHQAPEVARLALWDPLPLHRRGTGAAGARGRLGDLSGVLETLFDEVPAGTRGTFLWYARVTNPARNLLGYVAERVYRHSHDSVMREGEEGLRRYCARGAGS
jgi:hypothetical protein